MNVKTLDELMSADYPEQEYIVDRIVPSASITILSGQSRSFKTYTLLDIALNVANGSPLFNTFPTTQTPVLMIDEENGESLLQKRLMQLDADKSLPVYTSSFSGFHLDDVRIKETIELCKKRGVKLVIIDALIRVHSSDENSARDMSKVFKKLREFTKPDNGISILVTQHHRKAGTTNMGAGNEMRGSSDILAAVDSHIAVSRKDKYYLRFTQEKQRYDEELDPFEVKVNVVGDHFAFEYLGALRKPANISAVLYTVTVNLLTEHGELATGQLLTKIKESGTKTYKQQLSDLLERWVKEGALPEPRKGKGNTTLYWARSNGDD